MIKPLERLCYLAPDAAAVWDGVAKAGTYRQYQQCSEALEAFLALPKWQEFCREQAPDGAIALGAGSASKDLMIIESLQSLVPESRPKLAYRLVDYSIYMLTGTEAAIQTGLRDVGSWRPVEVVTLCKDFTDLKPWRHLRRPGVPAAWFINGGTIGNINEADFLNSIAKRAEVGDWLMISMDTIPEDAARPAGANASPPSSRTSTTSHTFGPYMEPRRTRTGTALTSRMPPCGILSGPNLLEEFLR